MYLKTHYDLWFSVSEWSTDLFADAANLLASDASDVESAGCPTELKVSIMII